MIEGTVKEDEYSVEPRFDGDDELFDLVNADCWTHYLTEYDCQETRVRQITDD